MLPQYDQITLVINNQYINDANKKNSKTKKILSDAG